MVAVSTALLVLACTLVGAIAGFVLRNVLPQHHLDEETKDLIKLTMGLIATMTALILGLVVTSAKAQFDAEDAYVKQSAANAAIPSATDEQYDAAEPLADAGT